MGVPVTTPATGVGRAALPGPKPLIEAPQSTASVVMLWTIVVAPFIALLAAGPVAWGWGLSPLAAAMAVTVSLLLPALIGGLVTGSWFGTLTAFFWAGPVRMALLHHVTWSVNSICHVVGERPFNSKDKATNFWPLAILSFGESWHNSRHADPTGARHGVLRGQIDPGARLIRIFEKLGWAHGVRWHDPVRLAAKRNDGSTAVSRRTAWQPSSRPGRHSTAKHIATDERLRRPACHRNVC